MEVIQVFIRREVITVFCLLLLLLLFNTLGIYGAVRNSENILVTNSLGCNHFQEKQTAKEMRRPCSVDTTKNTNNKYFVKLKQDVG